MGEPKIFKHSPLQLIIVVAIFSVIAVATFTNWNPHDLSIQIPILLILTTFVTAQVFILTRKILITDTDISAQSLLGTKRISWSDIVRVSGGGSGIKLHNSDQNIVIAPSPQLPRYEDIVEEIGAHRLDLFPAQDDVPMGRTWIQTGASLFSALVVILVSIGGLLAGAPASALMIPILFLLVFIGIVAVSNLNTPSSVTISGDTLTLKYPTREITLASKEIKSIELRSVSTRNGKSFFILLTPQAGKQLRINGLKPSLPIAYLTLKNWLKNRQGKPDNINASWNFSKT